MIDDEKARSSREGAPDRAILAAGEKDLGGVLYRESFDSASVAAEDSSARRSRFVMSPRRVRRIRRGAEDGGGAESGVAGEREVVDADLHNEGVSEQALEEDERRTVESPAQEKRRVGL
jgi:hypothetical protein